jgi:hypothetical protein
VEDRHSGFRLNYWGKNRFNKHYFWTWYEFLVAFSLRPFPKMSRQLVNSLGLGRKENNCAPITHDMFKIISPKFQGWIKWRKRR